MKIIKSILLILIIHPCFSQGKIAFELSKWKKINTSSYFNKPLSALPKENPTKITEKGEAKPEKTPEKPKENPNATKQLTIYFDKNNKKTTLDKAYYYRKAQFDLQNNPVGNVEDRFKASNDLKFTGSYFHYNPEEELTNNAFQGECIFFSEDKTKSVRSYKDGELLKETTFLANGKRKSEQLFNANKTRRSFAELVYDANGNEIESIEGKYNTTLKAETYKKTILNGKGKKEMVIDYENKCPKANVLFYDENGKEYPAIFQDFSCSVNTKEWAWQGNQRYTATFLETEKKYQILTNEAGMGSLTIPIEADFKRKTFEISAEFETTGQDNIQDIGIVWQYIDEDNYSYFTINIAQKTFDINMKIKGELKRFMVGIKPQLNLSTDTNKYSLKIVANPAQNKYEYYVNNQKIEGYNKYPTNPEVELKKMNSGFVFKPTKGGESILLNKFECKLF